MSDPLSDIAAERKRQIEVEGWTAEHDDQYKGGELRIAAALYAINVMADKALPNDWPWEAKWWKPKGKRRDLVKAAALIVAEIDRLDRIKP